VNDAEGQDARPKIFISYRIGDTLETADRLAAELQRLFGRKQVFFDRSTMEPGDRFPGRIETAVAGAEVVLVLIGETWLKAQDAHGERRLSMPEDWVRREVAIALAGTARVIPLLVNDAKLPSEAAFARIPELVNLTACQARPLRIAEWAGDFRNLTEFLSTLVPLVPLAAHPGKPPWEGMPQPPTRRPDRVLGWDLEAPEQAPPLELRTLLGLERGRYAAIVVGGDASALLAALKETEDLLSETLASQDSLPSLPMRTWVQLSLDRLNVPVFGSGFDPGEILRACDPFAALDDALASRRANDGPHLGFVVCADEGSPVEQRRRLVALQHTLASPPFCGSSPALIVAVQESDPKVAYLRLKAIANSLPKDRFGGQLLRLNVGHRRITDKDTGNDLDCSQAIAHAVAALGSMGGDCVDADLLFQRAIAPLPVHCAAAALDHLLFALTTQPAVSAALVEQVACAGDERTGIAALHLVQASDELLDAWTRGQLRRPSFSIVPADLIGQTGGSHTADVLAISLMRLMEENLRLSDPVARLLAQLDNAFPLAPTVALLRNAAADATSDRTVTDHLLETRGRDADWIRLRLALSALFQGIGPYEGLFEALDLDTPQDWWALSMQPPERAFLSHLLRQEPNKRAIFGLCTPAESERLHQAPLLLERLIACRRYRPLLFDVAEP